ncbi:MAG: hypothetical protein GXO87_00810 [Chlorobi bacterium]|nr:hypothetical protein [Chlorobiota bacterium]
MIKKGCFFVFVIIPVSIGILYYLYQKYGEELIQKGNKQVIRLVGEKIQNEFKELNGGKYSDSLKVYFDDFMDKISEENRELAEKKIKEAYEELKNTVDKNIGDSLNFENIKKVLLNYEK